MKKVLFATSALVMTAGYAAADVTIDGYGRFGLSYYENGHYGYTSKNRVVNGVQPGDVASDNSKTWMEQRLRFNIKASTETDGGVEFGGKLRMQYDDGKTGAGLNAAQLYFKYEGAEVQVGNTDTALDKNSAGLFKGSELGLTDTSFGNSRSAYYGYESNAYSDGSRSGIYASYGIAGFKVEASYVDPNQYGANNTTGINAAGTSSEKSLVASYETGDLTLSGGGTKDGAGIKKNDIWYVAGAYDFTEEFRAGLTYIHEGKNAAGYKLGKTTTVYGSYTTGPVKVQAYVANYSGFDDLATPNGTGYKKKTVFGLGANYDLGGGTSLRGGIHRDGYSETYGEFGVKFNF